MNTEFNLIPLAEMLQVEVRISAYPHPVLPKKTSAKRAQRIKKRCHFGMNRPD